jgi:hypothetical protein
MIRLIKTMSTFFLASLLTGCATKAYLPTYTDSPDYGTITLMRVDAEPSAPKLSVFAGKMKAASIRNMSMVTFSLPVGEYSLSIDWPQTPISFEDTITPESVG